MLYGVMLIGSNKRLVIVDMCVLYSYMRCLLISATQISTSMTFPLGRTA